MLRPVCKARHALVADERRKTATMGALFKYRRIALFSSTETGIEGRLYSAFKELPGLIDDHYLLCIVGHHLSLQKVAPKAVSRSPSMLTSMYRCQLGKCRRHRLRMRPLAGIRFAGPSTSPHPQTSTISHRSSMSVVVDHRQPAASHPCGGLPGSCTVSPHVGRFIPRCACPDHFIEIPGTPRSD